MDVFFNLSLLSIKLKNRNMKYFTSILVVTLLIVTYFFISSNMKDDQFSETLKIKYEKPLPGPDSRPYEWAYLQRVFPYMKSDPNVYMDALEQAHYLQREARENWLAKGESLVQWEFAGPINVGGRVVDLEINPDNPNIIYAAFATGGVFKSTDMGANWFSIFDSLNVLTIGDVAIDQINTDIIYVGTGEANGGHNNFPGGGVFKSTDAGNTWNFLGLTNTTSIGRIIINPTNTDIIYLAAVGSYFSPNPERGIYKSTDGGNSWNQSLFISDSTGAIDVVMDPNNPEFLFAAMWERVRRPNSSHLFGPSSGVYRSTNGGDSWEHLGPSTGLPNSSSQNIGRIGLAISKSNPNITYALYTNGSIIIGLYKTIDFGDSWVNVDPDGELGGGVGGFSWYFGQVRVSPTNPDMIYVLDQGFMRSTNGGTSWNVSFQTHVDHHALAFNPTDPNWIIDGNDGGINISTNAGVSWGPQADIPATQFYEIGLDANNPAKLYGGTQDNGTNRTQDGGLDNWQHIFGGDGFYVIVDHTNPDIIFAESQFGNLGKSTNGGSSFSNATNGINGSEPTNWSTPVVMDPNDANILYYGTDRIYRTTNSAGNWTAISDDLTDGIPGTRLGTVTTITVAPSNSNVIYAGTDDSHVWATSDFGSSWTDISGVLPTRWVTRVAVDPVDENIIYVTFSGLKWRDPQPHVFRSSDMGVTWNDISSNLPDAPVNAFAVDNYDQSVLYVGNDVGMYVSFNTGGTWEFLGQGIPIVTVGDIKIHPTENFLVAGTHGRGMYKINLDLVTGIETQGKEVISNSFILSQNYPNPFNPSTSIQYTVSNLQFVSLRVYDILGNEVATLASEEQPPGTYEINFNALLLTSGVYFYKLQAGDFVDVKKMILLK
jgi:Secretion system C-terminal sorting domain